MSYFFMNTKIQEYILSIISLISLLTEEVFNTFFHSRKKDLVIQEIYAKLILYNFCELITGAIVVEKKERKYSYRINFSIAIAICTEFLRRSCSSPPIDVIALIGRELIAVRLDRRNPRYLRARTATTFQYR